jgi:hypothetical protein
MRALCTAVAVVLGACNPTPTDPMASTSEAQTSGTPHATGGPPPPVHPCESPGWPCDTEQPVLFCGEGVDCVQSEAHSLGFGYCTVPCGQDADCKAPGLCISGGCRDALYDFTPAASCP